MHAAPAPRRRLLLAAAGWALCAAAGALDNPEAPDWSAAFLARAKPLEDRLTEVAGGPDAGPATQAYAKFLEAELNQAYRALQRQLQGDARAALIRAQRQWLAFREAEMRFIARNWTPQAFGSSAALSRADYQASLVKQRVLALLAYLQNYPPS